VLCLPTVAEFVVLRVLVGVTSQNVLLKL
jgi:hypothetical protein